MVVVIQVEAPLATENPRHFRSIALVTEDVLADRSRCAEPGGVAHIIVGGADEVSRVTFFDQFGHRPRRHQRDIVGVSLEREKHFSLVRLAGDRALKKSFGGRWRPLLRCGMGQSRERTSGDQVAKEIASKHGADYTPDDMAHYKRSRSFQRFQPNAWPEPRLFGDGSGEP